MRPHDNGSMGGRRTLLGALLLAGIGLNGVAAHAGIQAVTDPTTAFTYGTRLPGGRTLRLSKRPACRLALSPMVCLYYGQTDHPRLSIRYYARKTGPVEYTFRVPQR